MTILGCVVGGHRLGFILGAGIVCMIGAWSVIQLHERAARTMGRQRMGWHFLTAVAAGSTIWTTHFVAMLGFEPGVPVAVDPVVTIVSLLVAILGASFGFILAVAGPPAIAPALGGAVVGLATATTHYTGMMAYRVQGIVSWKLAYLAISVLLSVVLSALALRRIALAGRRPLRARAEAGALLVLAILALHFTGMAAFSVAPLAIEGGVTDPDTLRALAVAVAALALVVVGTGAASHLIDGSARAEADRQLRQTTLHDWLTGLPNRRSFAEILKARVAASRRTGQTLGLVHIDIDGFREINDAHGHEGGDEILRALAFRLSGGMREGELVARIGADEFAAIVGVRNQGQLTAFLDGLREGIERPVPLDTAPGAVGASMGVALYPADAANEQELLAAAALALSQARSEGRRRIRFFDRSMGEAARARRGLANDLRGALEGGELAVHYQPQVNVRTGALLGYEALLRWTHPRRGRVPPSEFIPLAEEGGLIRPIGEWVLRQACGSAAGWPPGGAGPLKVAVNLSPRQFLGADLPGLVRGILLETGLPPERLELELTETALVDNRAEALAMLEAIRSFGVGIALDDFGTGYSSLDTLRSYPFTKIKLDRTFLSEVERSPQAIALLRAVVGLGRGLDMAVLAEGVETEGQAAVLIREGCDEAQGYLYGRPAPIETAAAVAA